MATDSLGIVLPAYKVDLEKLNEYIEALENDLSPKEIIVEYDEPNGAGELSFDVNLQAFDRRRGKGAAIKHGFNELETDILIFADSDGSVPVESLINIVESVKDGADLAVGSRRHPKTGSVYHQKYVRKILGDLFAKIAGALLEPDLYDYQCGAKAIDASAWEKVKNDVEQKGFTWDIELICEVASEDMVIKEVPVEWLDQSGSTVSIGKTVPRFLKVLALQYFKQN